MLRLCGMQLQAVLKAKMITDSTRALPPHSYLLLVSSAFPSALAPGRRFDERRGTKDALAVEVSIRTDGS
jgi:hypothetical protein